MNSKARLVTAMALSLAGCTAVDLAALAPGEPRASETGENTPKFASATQVAVKPVKVEATLSAPAARHAKDPKAAIADARSLSAAGKSGEARVLLETASRQHEANRDLKVALGLVELDLGNPKAAEVLLVEASRAGSTDWQVLSGLGVAASTLGRQADAQKHLKSALRASPNNPAVLNNLAISYILERKPAQAEAVLKEAAAGGVPAADMADTLALARTLKARLGAADPAAN